MNILYDLDGTISDPKEGITKSLNYALTKLGHKERESVSLTKFIGPPLKTAFSELLDTNDEDQLSEAILLFRERYIPIGFKENTLYPGIVEMLSAASDSGIRQFIATSKREDIARSVVENFQIDRYFQRVYGCDVGRSKIDLVGELLKIENLEKSHTVMVGDRSFDIEAGKANGVKTIGVLWGYGSMAELENAGADQIVASVEELSESIKRIQAL